MENWLYTCPEILEERVKANEIISTEDPFKIAPFIRYLIKKISKSSENNVKASYVELGFALMLKLIKLTDVDMLFFAFKNQTLNLLKSDCKEENAIAKKYVHEVSGPRSLFKIVINNIIDNIGKFEDILYKLPLDLTDRYFSTYNIWMYKNINS